MQLLVIDFETRFSAEYSLSRKDTNTESYVRDPRFRAHGCGIRYPNGEILWHSHDDLPRVFASIDWDNTAVLAHHLNFDGLILSHHYGVHPRMMFCTKFIGNMVLPRRSKRLGDLAQFFGLPDKNVPYHLFRGLELLPPYIEAQVAEGCKHDVWLNYEIFRRMLVGDPARNMPAFPPGELAIVSETVKMFTSPALHIDVDRAEALATRIAARKEDTLDELGLDRELLASRECFADLLRELNVEPPVKISKNTKKETYAFGKNDAGMKALLDHDDENVVALVSARLGVSSTINETRARRFAATGRRAQPVPVYLNYASTFSTRWSGGDSMNWQNFERLPNKIGGVYETNKYGDIRKGEIRLCVKAPPGHKLVICDLSQIEARMLGWHAGQADLVRMFADRRDVYSEFIEPYYGYKVSKETPSERGVGKASILSMGYQAGDATIKHTLALGSYGPPLIVTLQEAGAIKNYYRGRMPKIAGPGGHWDKAAWAIDVLAAGGRMEWGPVTIDKGRVWLPNGTWLDYTEMRRGEPTEYSRHGDWQLRTRKGWEKLYSGKVTAHVNSALARVVMTDAMHEIAPRYKIALTVHDELVACVPDAQAEECRLFMETVMSREPRWAPGLPVEAESHYSEVYDK